MVTVNDSKDHKVLVRGGPGHLRTFSAIHFLHVDDPDDLTAIDVSPTITNSDLNLLLPTGGPIPSKFFYVPGKTRGSHAESRMKQRFLNFRGSNNQVLENKPNIVTDSY